MNFGITTAIICAAAACAFTFIALRNWQGDRYLCEGCRFNNEEDCLKPDRPRAIMCTAYRSIEETE